MERFFTSFPVGRILGIEVRIHLTLVLLLGIVAFGYAEEPRVLYGLAILMFVLVLHELGHSLAARRLGVEVVDITLWPLGGMARMRTVPEIPRVEGWLAAAGPAVNFALALVSLPFVLAGLFLIEWPPLVQQLVVGFFAVNLLMGIFNLIPMFPSDGGRILRALFALNTDWLDATRKAVIVGRVFAVLLGLAGVALRDWMLPLVAAWLWWMGTLELAAVRARHERARAARDGDAFSAATAEPVVVDLGVDPAARDDAGSARDASPRARRFTDEDIERLERHRGRLRSPSEE